LRFARDAVWISLISVAQVEAATVAIGKLLGEAPLGVFAMSRRFTRLPQFGLVGPFSSVVYVRMAKAQDDPEQLVAIYLASIRLLAAALIPPLALVAAAGSAVFVFLLSEDWAGVAPVFALAVPGIVLEAVTITCLACLFRATGRTELQVRLRLEGALVQIALVTLAAFHSLEAVAASLTLWALYFVPRGWALARRIVPLGWGACLGAIARPVAMATAASAAHLAFRPMLPPGALPEIVLAIVLAIAALGAMAALDWRRLRAAVALFR
jgi:O-antigen/teichoic acid export membrane protein